MDEISQEQERIVRFVAGENAPQVQLVYSIESQDHEALLRRITSVMEVVLSEQAKKQESDSWWEKNLPDWFVATFGHTTEELLADQTLWHFGSWIDAFRYRGWEWWSSSLERDSLTIKLVAFEHPYVVGPFEYLIQASGGRVISFDGTD